ncbi:hypothetical protein D3C84_832170 [compost metagenome]
MPGVTGLFQHRTTAGDGEHHPGVFDPAATQLCQAGELAEREVRVTQRDHLHAVVTGTVELAPTAQQVRQADCFHRYRDVGFQCLCRVECFGCDPGDMKQRRG